MLIVLCTIISELKDEEFRKELKKTFISFMRSFRGGIQDKSLF